MERWLGRVALVTGASSGIGAAIAENLVRNGMKVVGCGRNVANIDDLSKKLSGETGKLFAVKCDLQKEEDILAMFKKIQSEHGRLDVCINNAGLSCDSSLLTGKTEDWKQMLDVNILALSICTREAYAMMRASNIDDGQIIHISSVLGHKLPQPPRFNIDFYSCTKFMVQALLEALRNEIRATNTHIRVTGVGPGVVETQFSPRMIGAEAAKQFYSSLKVLQAKDIADAVEVVLRTPGHVEIRDMVVAPTEQLH